MKNVQDVNSTIFDLRKRGYRLDFIFFADSIFCVPLRLKIKISDIEIDETYKFSSIDNPEKQNMFCAIKCHSGRRGILFDVTDHFFELLELIKPKSTLAESSDKIQRMMYANPAEKMLTIG